MENDLNKENININIINKENENENKQKKIEVVDSINDDNDDKNEDNFNLINLTEDNNENNNEIIKIEIKEQTDEQKPSNNEEIINDIEEKKGNSDNLFFDPNKIEDENNIIEINKKEEKVENINEINNENEFNIISSEIEEEENNKINEIRVFKNNDKKEKDDKKEKESKEKKQYKKLLQLNEKINTIENNNIHEIKNDINENEGKNLDNKAVEKIFKFSETNYHEFILEKHFCDYNAGEAWRSGYILSIVNGIATIIDATNPDKNKKEINIKDRRNISYIRKYSLPDIFMTRGSSKNLKNKLTQFTNFHKDFDNYLENCSDFDFYYFLRVTVYYGLDFSMNSNIAPGNELISFQLILSIIDIIIDCLKFIKKNFKDFIDYETTIKNTELADLVLVDKKYAIFSFFDDIHFLLKKIFADSPQHLNWYIKLKQELIDFNPALNTNKTTNLDPGLDSLLQYKKKEGLKKICVKEIYDKPSHVFYTLDKEINSGLVAYFVDYFNHFDGFKILFKLAYSMNSIDVNNYKIILDLLNQIINDLFLVKAITDAFHDTHENEKKNLDNYVNNYLNKLDEKIFEKIGKKEFFDFFSKIFDLIEKDEEKNKVLKEKAIINFSFNKFISEKKLEKRIFYLTEINNIISSTEYNDLYKKIYFSKKENTNMELKEDSLNDVKFKDRYKDIKSTASHQFCQICHEKNIIQLILGTNSHEEIIKRLYPVLKVMYMNNFGLKEFEKEKIQKEKDELFNALFHRLREAEKNNEIIWKILHDIIINFTECLSDEDKYKVFLLIKTYFIESINISGHKQTKNTDLFDLLINFSLKSINEKKINLDKESNFDDLPEEKFYCLDMLLNIIIDKKKINELNMNLTKEQKEEIINLSINGIAEIFQKANYNEILIKTVIEKIMVTIFKLTNIIQNNLLLEKLIPKNVVFKEAIEEFCSKKTDNDIINLINELTAMVESQNDELFNSEIKLEKILDFIFILFQSPKFIKKGYEKMKIFELLLSMDENIKKIFYTKLIKNLDGIIYEIKIYIFNNILTKPDTTFKINDVLSYQVLKEFVMNLNTHSNKFTYITESEFFVLFQNIKDIFGYEKLFQILLDTDNSEIQNDIQGLISEIYLNVKFSSMEKYKEFWNNYITNIIELLKKLLAQKNNKAIKGVIGLLKKIIEKSNDDGEVIKNKQIINGLIDKAKNNFMKENETKKQNSIKIIFDYNYYDKNYTGVEKISTSIIKAKKPKKSQEKNISEMVNQKMKGEIYENEFLYYLRYLLSYECELPLRCIEIILFKKDNTICQKYNLLDDYLTIYDTIKSNFDSLKKIEQFVVLNVRKIKNPLNDEKTPNLMHIIKSNKELLSILRDLLKQKNYNNLDVLEIMKDNDNDDIIKKGIFEDFNKLLNDPNNSVNLLNELFNFENANAFYKNFILTNLYDFMTKNNESKENIISKLIKSNIWENKFKNLDIRTIVIKDSIEEIKYIYNLLNIYCTIAEEIKNDNQEDNLEILSNKIFDIYYLIVNESINKKIEKNEIKNIYFDILDKINKLFEKKDKISLAFVKLIIKEKEKFSDDIKYFIVDGILKNKFPFLNNKIQEFISSLVKNKIFNENQENINGIRNSFYLNLSSLFFHRTDNVNKYVLEIIMGLFKNINDENEDVYLYNIKLYYSIISKILYTIYKYTSKEINYPNYITEYTIPYIYEPLIKKVNKYSAKINDIFFGAQCQILYNFIDLINLKDLTKEQYDLIFNYKGKNMKKYLFEEIIMLNCDKKNFKNATQLKKCLQIYQSSKEANHLFISLLMKDINNKNDDLNEFLEKINSYNTLGYWYGDDISNWKLNYNSSTNEAVRVNNFIGLKNLGCTCYMNSLMQTFYNIVPLRESILRFKIPQTKKNCLYELQKLFFSLKFCKERYYTPSSFVENYDNDKLNIHQQMDIDEFFSNLVDRLENRMKNSENENLVKYFFQGHINDVLTFQEGCSHHRANTSNFYSVQLQIRNKKSLYESLDTLIEGELMNEDNCIICPQCNKKMPAIKSQNFKTLPRMLIFVLKRFEFDFNTMTRIKLNDYYEFPVDLDMNKYTGDFLNNKGEDINNKYKLKSIVIHQGSCEGGHYYAFIRDNKTQEWHQFNDTNVTYFDPKEIPKEAYGGNTNKNAYLLFYEKDDTSNCEMFDKIQEIKNLEENNENENENEEKEDEGEQNENNVINENEIIINKNKDEDEDEFNLIKEEEIKINEIREINTNEKREKNKNKNNNNIISEENIDEEDIKNYLNKKLFSKDYHHLTLEMYINALYYFNNNLNEKFLLNETDANLNKYNKIHPIEKQLDLPEKPKEFSQNLSKYIESGKLKIFKTETKLTDEEIKEKYLFIFKCIILSYFNVIIHSEERKYLGCYVDLIKFLVVKYEYCANYLLEEFSNYNVIMEYLKNCPLYEIKKVTVGIINYAMITSINIYQLNKNKNSIGNKDQNSLNENNNNIIESINDEDTFETLDFDFYQFNADEIKESQKATKESQKPIKKSKKETKNKNKAADEEFEFLDPEKELKRKEEQNEPYSQHYQDSMENDNNSNFKMNELHDASQNSSVLKNKNIPENILKLIYNIIYVMKKIKFHNFIESRFLFAVLIKFSLIANYTFDFILKNLNLSIPLNLMMFQQLSEKNYSETIFTIGDSDLHETTHRILDPKPKGIIQGDFDKFKNINLKYGFQFLLILSYVSEPSKDRIPDPGFSFYKRDYLVELFKKINTKQELVFMSNLLNKKCFYNKEFFKNLMEKFKNIIESITDGEESFYDKFDVENNNEIYRNEKKKGNLLRRIKSDIHYIYVNLFLYAEDNLIEFRQKEILNVLFNLFKEYKKYYGLCLYIINIIIDIYLRWKEKDKKKLNRLNEIKDWLEKYKIAPKLYEIKGIEMYKDIPIHSSMFLDLKNLTEVNKKLKDDFDKEEIAKSEKKIELINSILNCTAEKNLLEIDLSKYNFNIKENVIYANKKYEVVQVVDEMIKIKEIKNYNDNSGNDNMENKFKVKGYKEKTKKTNINEKEKEILWIENDNYKLKIIM